MKLGATFLSLFIFVSTIKANSLVDPKICVNTVAQVTSTSESAQELASIEGTTNQGDSIRKFIEHSD